MMIRKKLPAALLLALFMLSALFPAYADQLDDTQQELQNVNRALNQQQQQLNQTQKAEQGVIAQMAVLEKEIKDAEDDLSETTVKIDVLKIKITEVQEDIEIKQHAIAEKSKQLGDRLVYIFEDGNVSYLEILFSSNDFSDFLTRYEMLSVIVSNDKELINTIKKERAELEMTKGDLEVSSKELEQVFTTQQNLKNDLEFRQNEKQKMLQTIQNEKAKYQEAIDELESNSYKLEQMIRSIQVQSGGGRAGTGVYTWPLPGYSTITSPFGMRFHPILQVRKLHTGVDIAAPSGANIVAADDGTVIFSASNGGYGQTIIIDHGKNMSTLYAHQSVLIAKVGDEVTKGQIIGKVGTTGWSTGPHLHFEVRVNGTPTDPMSYI
jgi:murein DD-endopeptidase MepM/ murein hydrolase activator NlpD